MKCIGIKVLFMIFLFCWVSFIKVWILLDLVNGKIKMLFVFNWLISVCGMCDVVVVMMMWLNVFCLG